MPADVFISSTIGGACRQDESVRGHLGHRI